MGTVHTFTLNGTKIACIGKRQLACREEDIPLANWLKEGQGVVYWSIDVVLIIVGVFAGHWLEKNRVEPWRSIRCRTYQGLQLLAPRQIHPETAIVLIGNEEYWSDELARRVPIKRTYLAKLLQRLDAADAAIIALDFDLSSPTTSTGDVIDHEDYKEETRIFLETVRDISLKRTIVLPTTVALDEKGSYVLEPAIFDKFDFGPGKVQKGYIMLPYDCRQVPLTLELEDRSSIDSFAEAIVRARKEAALKNLPKSESLPFGSFIEPERFKESYFSAGDIINKDIDTFRAKIAHKTVIVGGDWHRRNFGRGDQIDMHLTPVGYLPGVYVHANYVEALLDSRVYPIWGKQMSPVFELISGH